ncbi:heme o synthase [Flectobacillus longus]|jgi:protoheme IX farnesyltransferase|uniref:Protoheme IX farnesyltransferase n=1 Tax=Flectobacillus longus TaxID=2984207 RepID=A0ABT6YSS4_9BACT|nr:heme o synthase [Flectobacillus longus]MDI9866610.1 heme o synthase [Flectobacillus longus]MDI9881352.1 heme o synthase [Flectobacillus longus]
MVTTNENISIGIAGKVKAYYELLKFRLSFLVAFSGAFGYSLAVERIDWERLTLISLAGLLITGAANIVNQVKEIELDKLMKRTAGRPLPTGRLSVKEASIFCLILLLLSSYILFFEFNFKAGVIGVLSFILYGFVYTPLKRVGPISVFVGAIPGAFPPMIGWIAATNHFGLEPGILFAIQFFWQFPHFWAIAWVADEDYQKAGFKMLPNNGHKDLRTAITIMIYTIFLVPCGFVPYMLGMAGVNSAMIAVLCGVLFLSQTFYLMMKPTDKSALMMMFGSFIYLPIVQIAFLMDKV